MKNKKILRIFGLALIFSLFMALLPAAPALGAETISLNPTQGMIGATVTIYGNNFSPSTDASEKMAAVYFSPTNASVGQNIDLNVTTYELVVSASIGFTGDSDEGEFSGTFTVPSTCDDGAVDANVAPGVYYIYITVPTSTIPNPTLIKAKATFTVTQGATLDPLSPTTGAAGTNVMVSGYNFPVNTALTFKFDSVAIAIKSGDTSTRSSGVFITTITIPSTATAGAHTITVTAGVGTATTTFTVTAPPSLSPLVPISGPPGTDITITGTGYPVNTALVFQFGTTTVTPKAGSLMTGSNGSFMTIITVPSTAADGAYIITVTAGTASVTASFTVSSGGTTPTTTPPPTDTPPPTTTPSGNPNTSIQILTSADTVGAPITIIGLDFTPGAPVLFSWDSTNMTAAAANNDGFVTAAFNVPAGMHGSHTITATDGVNSDSITFAVESTSPGTPMPLAPGMGAKVKFPATFDWDPVEDASAPVTYDLQIATDPNFSAGTIIINKTGIETAEYTLTEDEEAKLSNSNVSYYWRERGVDAALNASAWTGAGEFTVAQPFKFTGWPLYLTIAVGAVVFFLLGLWLGRRTAFYY